MNYIGGTYPGTGGTCGTTLANGSQCTIAIEFNPTLVGIYNDQFQIDYFDGANNQSVIVNITGVGAPPADLTISDGPTFDYGQVAVNGQLNHIFTVQNIGGVDATGMNGLGLIPSFDFEGGLYPGLTGDCGLVLAAGDTCQIVVTYTPQALGPHSDTIEIDYFDGANNQTATRDIQGTGVNPAFLTIAPDPHDFGTLATGSVTQLILTVSNTGDVPATNIIDQLTLADPFRFEGGTYPGTTGSCLTDLAVSANCSLVVEYFPTTTGAHASTVTLQYNDGATVTTATSDLSGTGTAPAFLNITEIVVGDADFGIAPIGATRTRVFNVTNNGTFNASLMSGGGLATVDFDYQGGLYPGGIETCNTDLGPAATCTIEVEYAPGSVATHNDMITINYFDGAFAQMANLPITGEGVSQANLAITPSPHDYGSVAVGGLSVQTFTLTNSGGYQAENITDVGMTLPLNYIWPTGSYPGHVRPTGCGTTLAGLSGTNTCELDVAFDPQTPVDINKDGQINLIYDTGVLTAQAASGGDLDGTPRNPALLQVTSHGAGPYDFNLQANGSTTDETFTLTNNGNIDAVINTVSIVGTGPFTIQAEDCTTNSPIVPTATCDVTVRFAPTVTGNYTGDLFRVDYNDGTVAGDQLPSTMALKAIVTPRHS